MCSWSLLINQERDTAIAATKADRDEAVAALRGERDRLVEIARLERDSAVEQALRARLWEGDSFEYYFSAGEAVRRIS